MYILFSSCCCCCCCCVSRRNLARSESVSSESSSQVGSNVYIETSNTNVISNIHINASGTAVSTVSFVDTVAQTLGDCRALRTMTTPLDNLSGFSL